MDWAPSRATDASTFRAGVDLPDPGRAAFGLDPAWSHLNHGSFGHVPSAVQDAADGWRRRVAANPTRFVLDDYEEQLAVVADVVAAFLGAPVERSAFVRNATEGMQLAIDAVAPAAGEVVLGTAHAYPPIRAAWRRACDAAGARWVEADAGLGLAAFAADPVAAFTAAAVEARRAGTRVSAVVTDHVISAGASVLDVDAIVAFAHGIGARAVVDAAHVPGHVEPGAAVIEADVWVGNLHKWAFAPAPTAVLVVADELAGRVRGSIESWRSEDASLHRRLSWQGTFDPSAWLAAPTGILLHRYWRHRGAFAMAEARMHDLELGVLDLFGAQARLHAEAQTAPLLRAWRLPSGTGAALDGHLQRRRVQAWAGPAASGEELLRVSVNVHTGDADVERLLDGLRTWAPTA